MKNINKTFFNMDLSKIPSDVIPCISKHLIDYEFNLLKDPELYTFFFKFDKPTDYKDYIKYKNKIENNEYSFDALYDFTESAKTDLSFLLKKIKKEYKNIKSCEIKFFHNNYLKSWEKKQYYVSPFKILFYDKTQFKCLTMSESRITESKIDGSSGSKDIKQLFKTKEEHDKIKQIFEDLKNDFNLYTKRCISYSYKKPSPATWTILDDGSVDFDF
jgi:hypothetical protein